MILRTELLGASVSRHVCVVSAADNGTIHMWDWRTGYNFQRIHAAVQPGSLDSESGIFSCVFDHSESRLITAEADKTIKVYKEDDMAVSCMIRIKDVSRQSADTRPICFSPCRQKKVIPSTGNQKSSREKDSNFFISELFLLLHLCIPRLSVLGKPICVCLFL